MSMSLTMRVVDSSWSVIGGEFTIVVRGDKEERYKVQGGPHSKYWTILTGREEPFERNAQATDGDVAALVPGWTLREILIAVEYWNEGRTFEANQRG